MNVTELLDIKNLSDDEIQRRWEEAYVRFETPGEEIRKFMGRLIKLGQENWRRDARIVEIFCGRGNGLKALEKLGFTNLEGVDISPDLLARYDGPARMYEADCRFLPFDDSTKDVVIVQGGLHHLPNLPGDLDRTLAEVRRVLKPEGRFVMVEPWRTPFLDVIHFLSDRRLVRSVSSKFDAFATMTHYEAKTYFSWIGKASEISTLLDAHFRVSRRKAAWGKMMLIGSPIK
jgi:ubiquinone/menaquinone biosynthesis C-methylase UbiE